MGIAAYGRGSKAIAAQIRAEMPDHNLLVIRRINSYLRGGQALFQPTVVRKVPGGWMIMNREEDGFASFGYEYPSLQALFAVWNAYVVGFGRDRHSFFWRVEGDRA